MICELCQLKKESKWYYEHKKYVILECKTDHLPMIVFREHNMKVDLGTLMHAISTSQYLFGIEIKFRCNQQQNKEHLHWHILNTKQDLTVGPFNYK